MAFNNNDLHNYGSLEEIRQRKNELRLQLDRDNQKIGRLWEKLVVKREDASRGEVIANLISNGAMAIDAFLMVRKLSKTHKKLFGFLKRKK